MKEDVFVFDMLDVALVVSELVCVVDGDVILQPKNVPFTCRSTSSFRADSNRLDCNSPEGLICPCAAYSTTNTCPDVSCRHPRSKSIPLCKPASNCVISFADALSPAAVSWHEVMLLDVSTSAQAESPLSPRLPQPTLLIEN